MMDYSLHPGKVTTEVFDASTAPRLKSPVDFGDKYPSFPAQCSCGHLIFERYIVRVKQGVYRPFTWCGFCRNRVDLADIEIKEAAL